MLADITHEVDRLQGAQPVRIVAHLGCIRSGEIEKLLELRPQSPHVLVDNLSRVELPLRSFSAGVADHSGSAANYGEGTVARTLKAHEHHYRHQAPYVQRRCSGVETTVSGDRPRCE